MKRIYWQPRFPAPPSGGGGGSSGSHPLIWLDSGVMSRVTAKRLASNTDWLSIKSLADTAVSNAMPAYTVTGATNANPCIITISQAVPWSTTEEMYIGGGTGAWAGINSIDYPGLVATKTGTNTFSIPIDSTAFGTFSGQTITLFPYASSGFSNGGAACFSGGYQGSSWYDVAFALGLCYQQLGGSYGTRAVQLLDYIVSTGVAGIKRPVSTDSYYATRFTLPAIAMIYDWCYALLNSTQKTNMATAVNFWYDATVASAFEWNGPLQSNYFTGHLWGVGAVGIATAGDNARSAEIVAMARTQHDTYVLGGFNSSGRGGYPFEAYGYGTNGYNRYLYYAEALRTSGGTNLTAEAPQLADSLIYQLRPDKWRVSDEGDYPGSYTGVLNPDYPQTLAYMLRSTSRGAWMQYMYDNLATVAGQSTPTVSRLLWYDTGGTSTNYTSTEPLGKYSLGDERLYRRSDWTTGAVWSMTNGASNNAVGSHQARTGGHIAVQRGSDNLLVFAGQAKGADGVSGSPEQFALSSGLANTLFHDDGGAYNFTGDAYWGGQGYWATNVAAKSNIDTIYNAAYVQTDLTPAYYTNAGAGGRSLTTFLRSNVKCGTGIDFVYDYVVRGSTSYTDDWRWHFITNGTLSAASGVATYALGSSKLFIKPLHLTTPTLTVGSDFTNFSAGTGSIVTKRLIVSEGTAATTQRCCHVLFACPSATGAMPTTTALTASSNTHYGAAIVDGSDTWMALFSADGSVQDSFTVTIP